MAEKIDNLLLILEEKKIKPEIYFGLKMAVDLFTALKTSPLGRRKIKSLKGSVKSLTTWSETLPAPE